VHALSRSKQELLPVLDEGGKLLGEIDLQKIRNIVFRTELYNHFSVAQLMSQPAARLGVNDPMEDVMKTFDRTDAQTLPVVDVDGTLVGYITRSHLYTQYRQMVADMSAD